MTYFCFGSAGVSLARSAMVGLHHQVYRLTQNYVNTVTVFPVNISVYVKSFSAYK